MFCYHCLQKVEVSYMAFDQVFCSDICRDVYIIYIQYKKEHNNIITQSFMVS